MNASTTNLDDGRKRKTQGSHVTIEEFGKEIRSDILLTKTFDVFKIRNPVLGKNVRDS